MKTYNRIENYGTSINGKLEEIANFSYNFNKIPPIIGMIIADQFGNTIMVLEYENKLEENYGSIKSYLSEDNKNLLETAELKSDVISIKGSINNLHYIKNRNKAIKNEHVR